MNAARKEAVTDLVEFSTWPVLPHQVIPRRKAEPEIALYAAVLLEAVRCLAGTSVIRGVNRAEERRRLRVEALAWIASPDRSDPFDFERVCELLGMEADRVRGWLQGPVVMANHVIRSRRLHALGGGGSVCSTVDGGISGKTSGARGRRDASVTFRRPVRTGGGDAKGKDAGPCEPCCKQTDYPVGGGAS